MTLLLGPVVIVARLFHAPQGPNSIYARCIRRWARAVNRAAGVTVVVHGREHMNQPRGAVFAANHVSWFDIFALAAEVPWCSFVAKAELRKIPLFGFAADCAGIVFLDRENRKQAFASYEMAAKEVQKGRAIIVCPEGTRGHDYHLRPFKKGPFVLAIASQSPVVPTVVFGAREVMRKGSFWIHSGRVELHFLEPVPTAGCDYEHRAELMTETWTRMADELRHVYGVTTSEHPVAKSA
jgi:1-acyl-sn-glycerol-3-phosphate acyltransferase